MLNSTGVMEGLLALFDFTACSGASLPTVGTFLKEDSGAIHVKTQHALSGFSLCSQRRLQGALPVSVLSGLPPRHHSPRNQTGRQTPANSCKKCQRNITKRQENKSLVS